MRNLYIAKFQSVRGRYLVWQVPGGYEGRKIHNAKRQEERYHNQPDPETGLHLNESHGWFRFTDVVSLRLFKK